MSEINEDSLEAIVKVLLCNRDIYDLLIKRGIDKYDILEIQRLAEKGMKVEIEKANKS